MPQDTLTPPTTDLPDVVHDAVTAQRPNAPPPEDLHVGPYDLLARIGRGGLGDVYRAVHRETGALVAVKLARAGRDASPTERRTFRHEIEAAARLRHPDVLPIIDSGSHDGTPYFVMPLVEGGTLEGMLADGPLPPREAAGLLARVARAVDYAHKAGVVHRDLKPANLLIGLDGSPKVADFGLARFSDRVSVHSVTGDVKGSMPYMAPEQAAGRGHHATAATDVWALGVILYECLSGRRPFVGRSQSDLLRRIQHEPPAPLREAPAELRTICARCLGKRPKQRYATAADLAADLERYRAGEPLSTLEVPPDHPRRRLGLAGTCWVALALGLFAAAAPAERPKAGSAEWLEQAERRAVPGKAVALIDDGKPGWFRQITGGDVAGIPPIRHRPGKPLDVTLHGVDFVEFLPPRAGRGPYRLTMRFRVTTQVDGFAGLYAGRNDRPLGGATLHTAASVTINEAVGTPQVGPPVEIGYRYENLDGDAALPTGSTTTKLNTQRFPGGVFHQGLGPWRTLSVEVDEREFRLVEPGLAFAWRWAKMDADFDFVGRRIHPVLAGQRLNFSPAGGAGVYLHDSSVEIEKLTVEFLARR